jgi:hypothetical protein
MTESDDNGNIIRAVQSEVIFLDGVTHDEVSEYYFEFLKGCGYQFHLNDKVCLVRQEEIETKPVADVVGVRFSETDDEEDYHEDDYLEMAMDRF